MAIIRDASQGFNDESEVVIQPLLAAKSLEQNQKEKSVGRQEVDVLRGGKVASEDKTIVLKPAYVAAPPKQEHPDKEVSFSEKEVLEEDDVLEKKEPDDNVEETQVMSPEQPPIALDVEQLNKDYEEEKARRLLSLDQEVAQLRAEKMAAIEEEARSQFDAFKSEGFKSGEQAAMKQYEEILAGFKDDLNHLFESRDEIIKKSEEGLLKLATYVAEKVIQVELKDHKEMIYGILKDAIERVTEKDHVIFYINPEHEEEFKKFQTAFPEYFRDIKNIDLRLDRSIKMGGIEIETKLGFIDSRVSTKLESINKALDQFVLDQQA